MNMEQRAVQALPLREDLKRRLLNNEFNCEKELTLSIISGKWKIVILWHLGHEGPHRFGELFRLFKNISNRILTKQLRELEQDNIITRNIYEENPPRVEYLMTERGMTMLPIVDAMFDWGKENMAFYAALAQKNEEKLQEQREHNAAGYKNVRTLQAKKGQV